MKRLVRITARARADVDAIFVWLARRSPQGAQTWYDAFFEAVAGIAADPDRYSLAAEVLSRWNRTIRQAFFKTPRGRRYRILFEVTEKHVIILRVRGHGQPPLRPRDLPSI
ncbi:MAG: type II toxin-antitoxin system RelE/ParE family toxin [Gemmataceae bacterium]